MHHIMRTTYSYPEFVRALYDKTSAIGSYSVCYENSVDKGYYQNVLNWKFPNTEKHANK